MMKKTILILLLIWSSAGCGRQEETSVLSGVTAEKVTPVHRCRVVASYPHDREAFTQGLVFHEGSLYEGTGRYGESTLRKVDLETGNVENSRDLPPRCFGEGIAVSGGRIIQLTWQEETGFVYDIDTLEVLQTFSFYGEGWGLTSDGQKLIMSNGTPSLHFLDPESFEPEGRISVYDEKGAVPFLNELEYINGEIWANVLNSELIARIDPVTGKVNSWADLSGILPGYGNPSDPLNGIAYDSVTGRLFVTGKLWPQLLEITIVE